MTETRLQIGLLERRALRQQALARIEKIPSLSTVVSEFLKLAGSEYFTARDFEKVISKDQALVARLLKVANSSFFSAARPIKAVHEAVVLIGMDNMKNIVYAVSSGGFLRRELKSYRYPRHGFWVHSMAVAMTCRALAEDLPRGGFGAEEAFVAGLLHDIGKLVLDDTLRSDEGCRDIEPAEEEELTGFTHAHFSQRILQRWNIPKPISEAAKHHHQPQKAGGYQEAAALVGLADSLCNTWGAGTRNLMDLGHEIEVEDYERVLNMLSYPVDNFLPTLWSLRQKLANIENFYGGAS